MSLPPQLLKHFNMTVFDEPPRIQCDLCTWKLLIDDYSDEAAELSADKVMLHARTHIQARVATENEMRRMPHSPK
jgi:hypothetical protein